MSAQIQLLDVVALTEDLSESNMLRGQVGTVVERLASGVFEVEFCDNEGRTYACLSVEDSKLMVLHHQPAEAG